MTKTKTRKKPLDIGKLLVPIAIFAAVAYAISLALTPPVLYRHLPVRPSVAQLKDGDYQEINEGQGGAEINLSHSAVYGKYTLFDFQSQYCPSCRQIAPNLIELTRRRPDIAVRSIDVDRPGRPGIDWDSPVCKQYHIGSLPGFKIYSPAGRLLVEGKDARKQVGDILQKELND